MKTGDCGLSDPSGDFVIKPTKGQDVVAHVHLSNDPHGLGLECVCVKFDNAPTQMALSKIYTERRKGVNPVIVFGRTESQAWLFGPNPESPALNPLSSARAAAILQECLNESTGFAASQRYAQIRDAIRSSDRASVRNAGLFASHHIRKNLPSSSIWETGMVKSKPIVNLRGRDLIKALGFTDKTGVENILLLSPDSNKQPRAVAVLLNENENFDARSDKYKLTPVAWGLKVAAENEVPWLIVLRGGQIRLYPAKDGVGVGQRSQVDTYFELDLPLLEEEEIPYLHIVFSVDALIQGGYTEQILSDSYKYASDLGTRLRSRIYESVVPTLAKGVAEQLQRLGYDLTSENLQLAYRLTLRILFRLIFQAYAEDRGLLPFERNQRYTDNALKTIAVRDLMDTEAIYDEESVSLWDDLQQVWRVIDSGDKDWNVPAYNGGLFGSDPIRHAEGSIIKKLELSNSVMSPTLETLLIDDTEEDIRGPVDFRSLSVREFGTIYEGLLESSLSLASENLTLDRNGTWVPARENDVIEAAKGTVYFHNSSGERKATGSYFTPSIIVEHLLDRALEPALKQHLVEVSELLKAGKENSAAEKFFDFRVADLAMGSAHFLVAAVDRIETAFRNFLVDNSIPAISAELQRLEEAAKEALGSDAEYIGDIDQASLLRRQVARRCIYGIDINEMAVELARLALWIHTFVPGLPMSSLDHGLVCANSLTGIGTFDELFDVIDVKGTLFEVAMMEKLNEAKALLVEAANAIEANRQEVLTNADLLKRAKGASEPIRKVFDAAIARRLGVITSKSLEFDDLVASADDPKTCETLLPLQPAHLPYLFPEVFLRENEGFNVLLGNPPWEEITLEENKFWKRYIPGYSLLNSAEIADLLTKLKQERPELFMQLEIERNFAQLIREAILKGPFIGMGNGDPDLYKGFAWRNVQLCRKLGRIGLVLPRGAWVTQGSSVWRDELLKSTSVEIDLLRNTRGWLFPNVNPGYQITSFSAIVGVESKLKVRGEYSSELQFSQQRNEEAAQIPLSLLRSSDPDVCIPSVTSQESLNLWIHMLNYPRLGDGKLSPRPRPDFRCSPIREIDAADGRKKLKLFTSNPKHTPVRNHRHVGSFTFLCNLPPFEYAEFNQVLMYLLDLRKRTYQSVNSAFKIRDSDWNNSEETHPILHPRIVFRDVIHSSNQKKAWFALVPSQTILTNKAPYLLFDTDDISIQAYVLGILNSSPADWFAHLRVNLSMNFFILYSLPIPLYSENLVTRRLIELTRALAVATTGDFKGWSLGVTPLYEEDQRYQAITEIDAIASLLFEIPENYLKEIWDDVNQYRPKLIDVLRYRKYWKSRK